MYDIEENNELKMLHIIIPKALNIYVRNNHSNYK